MSDILELGHTGVLVRDLDRCRNFYADVVGLTVTDEDARLGLVFLSSRPSVEHHELVLQRGRADDQPGIVQQISWRVADVEAVQRFHKRFIEHGVIIDRIVTHGNAIGVYFFDPEGNRNEVYALTDLDVRQPFARTIDLDQPAEDVLSSSRRLVDERTAPGGTS
jgi:catechol-2,3-dioxygenase